MNEIPLFLIPIVTLVIGGLGFITHPDVHQREFSVAWMIATASSCLSWDVYIYYVAVYLVVRFALTIAGVTK